MAVVVVVRVWYDVERGAVLQSIREQDVACAAAPPPPSGDDGRGGNDEAALRIRGSMRTLQQQPVPHVTPPLAPRPAPMIPSIAAGGKRERVSSNSMMMLHHS